MLKSVAAIIPAYNVEASIERAIRSALAQTRPPAEIIIVDDCSTDGTRAIVRALAESDARIRLIASAENGGPSRARNRAIEAATADRIAILDGDDAWRPERLERIGAVMDTTGAEFVADNLILYDIVADCEVRLGFRVRAPLTPIDAASFFANCRPDRFQYSLLKPLLDRRFLVRTGIRYRDDLRYGEDLFFYADLFLAGARGQLMGEGYYVYTSQFGEKSGKKSPLTHSVPKRGPDLAGMIRALGEMVPQADPSCVSSIERCIRSFDALRRANDARLLRRDKRWLAYARAMADWEILRQSARQKLRRLQLRLGG